MPLSKERDRVRKKRERVKTRLDKLLCKPQFAMRLKERKVKPIRGCKVCGYSETVDEHHEGVDRVVHLLCPNHHGLITRGIRTLGQLLPPQTLNPVQPEPDNGDGPRRFYGNGDDIDADGNLMPEI